ncbi:MAG: divergent polysaccharide deacetylase family protein [Pseudomonadota bacterium]
MASAKQKNSKASKASKAPKATKRGRARRPLGLLSVATYGVFGLAAVIGGAIAIFGDPLAGEPRVLVAIDPSEAQLRQTVAQAEAIDTAPPAFSARPGAPTPTIKPPLPAAFDAAGPVFDEPSEPVIDPTLVRETDVGPLPHIAEDGRRASKTYARPFDPADGRPRVALIVSGLGLSQATTAKAIRDLPADVTLSFVPYAKNLPTWSREARAAGHEVMLELPMEPFDYPANDPGPYTLLTGNSRAVNAERLDWLMSRFSGYFAAINYLGGKFTSSNTSLKQVMETLEARGVAYIDDGFSQQTVLKSVQANVEGEWGVVDRVIDARLSEKAIDEKLLELEALAIQNGAALGKGSAYPVTIDHIASWVDEISERGYVLAPASAVIETQRFRR